jgi:hypothetical protein
MSTFIKTGYWEKAYKGLKGWLDLDKLIRDVASSFPGGQLTQDELDALQGANAPSALNPLATTSDVPTALSELSEDATHRTVTDAEKIIWYAKQDSLIDNNPETGTTYTLDITDSYVTATNANPIVITVPHNTLVDFAIGTTITIEQGGGGQVRVVGAGSVTVNAYDSGEYTLGQYAAVQLIKKAANTWTLIGGTNEVATTTTTTTIAPTTTTTTTTP